MPLRFSLHRPGIRQLLLTVAALCFASVPFTAHAATITWNGGGTDATCGGTGTANNWSCAANWAGGVAPGTTDTASFDGTSTKNATISADITVGGITIVSAYTGTILQTSGVKVTIGATGFTQGGGTFTGGNDTVSTTGPFTLSGGTFTSTSSGFILTNADWIHSVGGTFNHNNGTVIFAGSSGGNVYGNQTFYNLTASYGSSVQMYIRNNATLTVLGTFTWTNGYILAYPSGTTGTINTKGNVVIHSGAQGGLSSTGSTLELTGTGTQTCSLSAVAVLPKFIMNNAQATCSGSGSLGTVQFGYPVTLSAGTFNGNAVGLNMKDIVTLAGGTFNATSSGMLLNGNWTQTAGTFNAGTGTVIVENGIAFSFPGAETFHNLTINAPFNGIVSVSAGSIAVSKQLLLAAGRLNAGTVAADGNVTLGSGFGGGTSSLTFSGNGTQVYASTGGTLPTGNWTVAKPSGTLVIASGALILNTSGQQLTLTGGTLDLKGNNLTVNDRLLVGTGATLKLTGMQTITAGSKVLSPTSTVWYTESAQTGTLLNLTYSNLVLGSTGSAVFELPANTLAVNGTLTLSGGTLRTTNGQQLTLSGSWLKYHGSFSAGTGTVLLDGGDQTMTGSTTFYNLTKKVTAAHTLTFAATTRQTVLHALDFSGSTTTTRLSLRSSQAGTQWQIDPQGTRNIADLDVKDSDNVNATSIDCSQTPCHNSGDNTGWTFSSDTTPPSVPTGLATKVLSGTQIDLSWTASTDTGSGISGYLIYRGGVQVGTSTTASYADTGLTPSTAYTYTVAAQDVAGNTSAQSAAAAGTTTAANVRNLYSCGYLDAANDIYNVQNDLTSTGTCLVIIAPKVTLSLNNHTVTYDQETPVSVFNGGFEETGSSLKTASGWDMTGAPNIFRGTGSFVNPVTVDSGSYALDFSVPSANEQIVSTKKVTLDPNTTYALSAFFNNSAPTDEYVAFSGTSIIAQTNQTSYRGFQFTKTIFTTGPSPVSYTVVVGFSGATTASATIDNVDDIAIQKQDPIGILVGPTSTQVGNNTFPGVTRSGSASGALIESGSVIQGIDHGVDGHGIYVSDIDVQIAGVNVTVSGVDADAIYGYYPAALTVHDSTLTSNVTRVSSRDLGYGAVIFVPNSYSDNFFNNTIIGGPDSGIKSGSTDPTKPNLIHDNTVSLRSYYTNSFAIESNDNFGGKIYNNTIDCASGDYSCRGIHVQTTGSTTSGAEVDVYNNTVTTRDLPRDQEYGGCEQNGSYAIQIEAEDNIHIYDNTMTAVSDKCSAFAFRFHGGNNISVHDNTFIARHATGATVNTIAGSMLLDSLDNNAPWNVDEESSYTGSLLIDHNTFETNSVWFWGQDVFGQELASNTFKIVGSPLDNPLDTLRTSAASPNDPTLAVNLRFLDNAYPDAATEAIFTGATLDRSPLLDYGADMHGTFGIAYTLTGTLLDTGGSPVSGATVAITNASGTTVYDATTNASGQFKAPLEVMRNFSGSVVKYNPFHLTLTSGSHSTGATLALASPTTRTFVIAISTTTPSAASAGGGSGGSGGGGAGGGTRGTSVLPLPLATASTGSAVPAPALSPSLSLVVNQQTLTFRDVPTTAWFAPFIAQLVTKGIVSGYANKLGHPLGLFGPANPVTYAEVAKMAILGAGLTPSSAAPQNPSARGQWSASYIAEAETLHLAPYTRSVHVNTPMARAAALEAILQAFKIPLSPYKGVYRDVSAGTPYAAAIATATNLGIVQGDTDATGTPTGTFRPLDPINRAEFSKILSALLTATQAH